MGIANITNNILTDSGAVIGAANGVATLDSGGKIPVTQLPNSVMEFKGTWSAATNTPTLANGTGNAGDVYEVSAAGTVNFGAGGIAFALGDYVVYDGATWQYSSGQKGTITSVALTVPSAFSVSGSPITTSGTFAITGAGSGTEYIDGTGALQTFPVAGQSGTLVREVRNTTGATLTKGTIVYISGATGNKPTVSKAIATADSTSAQTFGMCQANISNNSNGYVVCVGDLTGLDTSAFTEGNQLYLSSTTAGTYTVTKQLAPNHLVYIGVVTRAHPTQGQIEVNIQNGYELYELHDVSITSESDNQGLFYEASSDLWKNKSIATVLGYTPANGANYLPLTGGTMTGMLNGKTFVFTTSTNSAFAGVVENLGTTDASGLIVNIGASSTGTPFRVDKNGSALFTIANSGAATFSGSVGMGSAPMTSARLTITDGTSIAAYWKATNTNASARDWTIITNNANFGDFSIRQGNSQGADATSGTDRLIILAGGNVGIGTTSPDAKLTVVGASNTPSSYGSFLVKNTSEAGLSFGASATSYTWIQGNVYGSSTAPIALNAQGGNVLIGTTTDSGHKLRVFGDGASFGNGGDFYQTINSGATGSYYLIVNGGIRQTIASTGAATFSSSVTATQFNASISTSGAVASVPNLAYFKNQGNGYVAKIAIGEGTTSDSFITHTGGNTTATQLLGFGVNAYNQMVLTGAGNVGIGTTDPTVALGMGLVINGGATSPRIALKNTASGNASTDGFQLVLTTDLEAVLENRENASMRFLTNATEAMRITAAGNVGIGTTTPSALLHLQNSAGSTLRLVRTSNRFDISADNDFMEINARDASTYMTFKTADTERMRITSGGLFKFQNNGSSYESSTAGVNEFNTNADDTNVVFRNTATSLTGARAGIDVFYRNATPNSTSAAFYQAADFSGGSRTLRFEVRSNGGIANYAANNVILSDERTKKEIKPLESYWDKFKGIEIVKYKYKDQTHDDFNIGVIAQQVEKIAPEFVDIDGFGETPEDGTPLKSIYDSDLYHATIGVLKEAMTKIETLEAKIKTLENK